MRAYYNEHDRFAAAWLRELIVDGLIPDGWVDERDIQTVQPSDLDGFDQCHFFAGIGGWAYALDLAGWDGPVWTGSCPCQPFSQAGKGEGFKDARHLWPAWFRLIRECRPPVVFGEQVGGPDGYHWLDLVSTDLEEAGYAFGAADLAAAGVGAPHIRQRLYFVADAERGAAERSGQYMAGPQGGPESETQERKRVRTDAGHGGESAVGMADSPSGGRRIGWDKAQPRDCGHAHGGEPLGVALAHADGRHSGDGNLQRSWKQRLQQESCGVGVGLADANRGGRVEYRQLDGGQEQPGQSASQRDDSGRRNPWDDVIWLPCTDGKFRPSPTEPELQPLAARLPNRVGLLRGAGNAICAPLASEFVSAAMEAMK